HSPRSGAQSGRARRDADSRREQSGADLDDADQRGVDRRPSDEATFGGQRMKRRALDFRTIDEAVAEIDRLQKGGYEKGANWSLGQICNHAAIFVRGSIDGFTGPPPPWFIRIIAPFFV